VKGNVPSCRRKWESFVRLVCLFLFLSAVAASQSAPAQLPPHRVSIDQYIHSAWDALTRSMTRCDSIVDPKVKAPAVLYVPHGFAIPPALQNVQQECRVDIKRLSIGIEHPGQIDPHTVSPPGLLFLPNSYVVPGGRFNEMYGWDSYFIILGLLRDGRADLARGMVENFFFEIANYGTVLNANRTYYLSRSQPPFLTSMVMAVYEAEKKHGPEDRAWLKKAYDYASKDYEMWTHDPHLAGSTGLSRYFDFGQGPVDEGLQDENGYYRGVAAWFLRHPEEADHNLVQLDRPQSASDATGFIFSLQLCESTPGASNCDPVHRLSLSRDYYKGDRSMRESGFDVSFRFGPFSAHTHDYAPVCLNSLLYKTEKDLAEMAGLLGKRDDSGLWNRRAEARKQRINKYLWDPVRGLFFDYDFQTQNRSAYEYVTSFYPLWAGLASQEQARAVEKNLPIFEQPGGLVMSHTESGAQWDYPYGWAPTQLLAIQGLRRYGFKDDADRLSDKFLSMVADNFARDSTMREKYNVVTRSSETHVTTGYQQNVVGFGWTNGVFLELLHELPPAMARRLGSSDKQ
ncbi:MAG TPA: trehalase family glycosidase, partial [Terriglobales bacterium]|nr:trehalase family glycosidase [Terriglobales bacterium]